MPKLKLKKPDFSGWIVITLCLLGVVALINPASLSVVVYKLLLMTLAFVVGHWLGSGLLNLMPDLKKEYDAFIRVAIIVAAMISAALGM